MSYVAANEENQNNNSNTGIIIVVFIIIIFVFGGGFALFYFYGRNQTRTSQTTPVSNIEIPRCRGTELPTEENPCIPNYRELDSNNNSFQQTPSQVDNLPWCQQGQSTTTANPCIERVEPPPIESIFPTPSQPGLRCNSVNTGTYTI